MKNLEPITLGTHTVKITVSDNPAYPHVLFFSAICCGKTKSKNTMAHQGSHDHSDAQFEKDIAAHAQRLVEEVAGKCRSSALVKQFAEKVR